MKWHERKAGVFYRHEQSAPAGKRDMLADWLGAGGIGVSAEATPVQTTNAIGDVAGVRHLAR